MAEEPRIMTPDEWQQLLDHIDTLIRENRKIREQVEAAMKQPAYFPERRRAPRTAA
jgi:hypothetical protein